MNNDALMRRIAAATEAQKNREAAANTQKASAPLRAPTVAPALPEGPSHLASILTKGHDEVDPGPQAQQAVPQQAPLQPMTSAAPQQLQHADPAAYQAQLQAQVQTMAPVAAVPEMAQPQPLAAELVPASTVMSFKPDVDVVAAPTLATGEDSLQPLGVLVSCDGINATIKTSESVSDLTAVNEIAVGQMIVIPMAESRVIGLVYKIEQGVSVPGEASHLKILVELQGEIRLDADNRAEFSKGIASYPGIGSTASRIVAQDLSAIYAASGSRNAVVGHLSQDRNIPAYIDVEGMLSKHFAVLGSTGCGKSSAVSLLLRASHEIVPDLRTVILDPHNEYSTAFPDANVLDAATLEIPFWLFQLEEYAEVLFRGKPVVVEEIDALREFIPDAKQRYRDGEERTSLRTDSVSSALTADTPVPYRISDVLAIIDEELGMLEARFTRSTLKSLRARITAHLSDPRYAFMFRDKTISDKAEATLNSFFNLGGDGSLITILQMSGMPSEVVNSVASVLCRLSFELCVAAKGKLKILVVCEEAHRYVPADPSSAFEPTRRAIARIAKEGRKYGSFISIVSQRPAELDPTILSQCSTVFSLRMSNEQDQSLIRKAISSSSQSTISFLSSLANREAIAFGEGLSTPMRLKFRNLPQELLPGQDSNVFETSNIALLHAEGNQVFREWRGVAGAAVLGRPIAMGA